METAWSNLLRRYGGAGLVHVLELLGGVGLKGRLAREALVHDGAQGPEVRLGVVLLTHDHLGGHVHRGTAQGGRHNAISEEAGEPKVS